MSDTHPLTILKFCPKCGSDNFNISGKRSLKCGNCGFHYYVNSAAAVAALVINEEGKLMLTKRGIEPGYGKLDLPGGFVDPLETVENALERELFEELGLKIKTFRYIGSAPNEYIFSEFSVFTIDMGFIVYPETVEGLRAQDDILDFKFYGDNEIDYNEIPAPSIKHFVKEYFKHEYNQRQDK
jgi:NADH pyrophosphatase NudC (nudix superfamily)